MAGCEDEAEEIVPHLLVDRRVQVHAFLSLADAPDLFVLALERLAAPDRFDGAMRFDGCRLAAPWAERRFSVFRTYGQRSFTCLRTRKPHGPRRSPHRRVPASATREPRRSSAPATASTRPPAPCSPRT